MVSLQLTISLQKLYEFFNNHQNLYVSASDPYPIADYTYDVNGNMVKDLNKDIEGLSGEGIQYNHLNLPFKVQVKKNSTEEKGNIKYIYDASGVKLRKITTEAETTVTHNGSQYTTSSISTTDYIGGFIYESKSYSNTNLASLAYSNKLQFFAHEEGRTRPKEENNEITFVYDYFIKDHLGNVRMVLTEEEKTTTYPPASMEMAQSATEEALYANVSTTRDDLPPGYPTIDNFTNPNEKVAKVKPSPSGGAGGGLGPSITLKVMAGDKFNIHVSSWYKTNSVSPDNPVNIVNDLISSITTGVSAQLPGMHGGVTAIDLQNTGIFTTSVTEFVNNHQTPDPNRPKAYLNWILFDEQFKYVGSSSGAEQVPAETVFGTAPNNDVHHHVLTDLPITKNGYLYIYVSNETPNIAVYFDNLQVTHTPGPLLEETHYYPFGLVMSGISSSAANITPNKIKFQEQELASKEFSDGSGLEMYEFKWRMHDPQTGRFWQIDPLSEKYVYNSTYAFSENKVTGHRELEGLEAWSVNPITLENGNTVLSATVTDVNAPFSVTQDGQSYGYFPNAEMNRQLGGAIVSDGSLLVPVNANGDYNSYSGEGISNFNYMTSSTALTPTQTTNVITNGTPVVINGNRTAGDPIATTPTTTVTTPAITSATAPAVNLTYSDQGIRNTFTVRDNSSGTNVGVPVNGNGSVTNTANNFVSGGTMSVITTNPTTISAANRRADGYNFTLTVTPTVSTPTTTPTAAATANQLRIVQGQSRSLLNNVALPNN